MGSHPLVDQLHFARAEFVRCLQGVSEEDAVRRILPMNSLSWMVGHLANQEHRYWVIAAQGENLYPELNDLVGTGRPASTPPLAEMWEAWQGVTSTADRFLEKIDTASLEQYLTWNGKPMRYSTGTLLLRNIYHYWFHTGEANAERQVLGHSNVPQFVGDMSAAAYRPE